MERVVSVEVETEAREPGPSAIGVREERLTPVGRDPKEAGNVTQPVRHCDPAMERLALDPPKAQPLDDKPGEVEVTAG